MYQRVSSTLKINIKKFLSNNDIEVTILGQNIATIKEKKKEEGSLSYEVTDSFILRHSMNF